MYWFLRENRASLFLIDEGRGFFVLEVVSEPFKADKLLCIWLLWFLDAEKHAEELDIAFADIGKKAGCGFVQFKSPRMGWKKKKPKGYELKQVTWERKI